MHDAWSARDNVFRLACGVSYVVRIRMRRVTVQSAKKVVWEKLENGEACGHSRRALVLGIGRADQAIISSRLEP